MIARVALKERARIITVDHALTDQKLLGAALEDPTPWRTWLSVLRAAFGLPLTTDQQAIFNQVAGERTPPKKRVREFWCLIGRRGGKSTMAADPRRVPSRICQA